MSKLLKDEINDGNIKKLALLLSEVDSRIDINAFSLWILTNDWPFLTLKQRISRVSQAMDKFLKGTYREKIQILNSVQSNFNGLFHFVFPHFVELYGPEELENFELSVQAMANFTENSSSEFAVRPFIERYPECIKPALIKWAQSDNEHQRRLASESIRPRLPWAKHLQFVADNPDWVLPIIEQLQTDPSRYVQKSVANLLNDFTKIDADWVFQVLEGWDLNNQSSAWIAKHALRTLLKQGDVRALALIGYPVPEHIELLEFNLVSQVKLGEKLHFSFTLNSNQCLGRVRLEYGIHFLRNRQKPYRKVFKIGEAELQESCKRFQSYHDFKKISTRQYVPGRHLIEFILNGQVIKTAEFELI